MTRQTAQPCCTGAYKPYGSRTIRNPNARERAHAAPPGMTHATIDGMTT